MRVLLVAAGLCVGANAWATDYTIAWQNLFDDAGTYQDGWSGTKSRSNATSTVAQGTRSGDAKYISFANNGYNTVWTYTLSGISAISSATDYIFDMDFALTRANTNGGTGMKITNSSDNELFKVFAAGGDTGSGSTTLVTGSVYINGSTTAESETVTMNTFRGGTLTWYTIHITSNATDGTDLTLTKCDDATETKTYHLSDGAVALGKIILDPGYGWLSVNQGYYGGGSFDNFILKTPEDETSVSEPTFTITDFDGTSRTIELSTLTDGATIYYSETSVDPEETSAWSVYSSAFETTVTPIYAYAKKGAYSSTVATIGTGAGTAFKLNTPTWVRTGANSYRITATTTSALGIEATQTIHYTVNGGAEQTSSSPATINDVDGDIVAWTTASKFGQSDNLGVTYVPAIALADAAWTYDLNTYPKAHTCTSIASALDTENGKEFNEVTMYNLKEETYPNLYIENASGWLLRNQAASAWKCQTARTSIVFDNVTTSNVIFIKASNDNASTNCINNVSNGILKYNYSLNQFFIVPDADGAVKVTFNTGSSINDVAVYNTTVSAIIPASTYGTIASAYAIDCANLPTGVTAYKVSSISASSVTLEEVTTAVEAGTGLILSGTAGTYNIPFAASGSDISATNKLHGAVTETAIAANEAYILQGGLFHKVTAASAVPAGKAYLLASDVPGSSAARSLNFVFGDEATGISTVARDLNDGGFFNIQGQRVTAPVKGLYIVNGKKVLVK